ncbi:MAG: PEGA domain-containing protein [Candidatus Altiarchaeota archaeon]|nr:PEGA domain-containing protein [Candidatus Altiarchaeota archaeon]
MGLFKGGLLIEVSVTSTPSGASIFLDDMNNQIGETNNVINASTGRHTIFLTKPGYLTWSSEFIVTTKSKDNKIDANLTPENSVSTTIPPSDSSIYTSSSSSSSSSIYASSSSMASSAASSGMSSSSSSAVSGMSSSSSSNASSEASTSSSSSSIYASSSSSSSSSSIIATTTTLCPDNMAPSTDGCLVTNCTQLQNIQLNTSLNYALANDIDCSDSVNWNNGAGFIPIGKDANNAFYASLNGNNHTITNLYINSTGPYTGLFGYVRGIGTINNTGLVNMNIRGKGNTGSFAGYLMYHSMHNCFATGNIHSSGTFTGGLAGNLDESYMYDSYFIGRINSTSGYVGGVTRYQDGPMERVYSAGYINAKSHIGGIADYNNWYLLADSFSASFITYTYTYAGGGVEEIYGGVSNCYWYNWTNDNATKCYYNYGGGSSDCNTINNNNGGLSYFFNTSSPPMDKWDFNKTWSKACDGKGFPPLRWQNITDVSSCKGIEIYGATNP